MNFINFTICVFLICQPSLLETVKNLNASIFIQIFIKIDLVPKNVGNILFKKKCV